MKDRILDEILRHFNDDLPLMLASSFVLGYSFILAIDPQYLTSLALLDKIIQSILAGMVPFTLSFGILLEIYYGTLVAGNKIAPYIPWIEKQDKTRKEARENALGVVSVYVLLIGSIIVLYHLSTI